jgi:hypothetical protein
MIRRNKAVLEDVVHGRVPYYLDSIADVLVFEGELPPAQHTSPTVELIRDCVRRNSSIVVLRLAVPEERALPMAMLVPAPNNHVIVLVYECFVSDELAVEIQLPWSDEEARARMPDHYVAIVPQSTLLDRLSTTTRYFDRHSPRNS